MVLVTSQVILHQVCWSGHPVQSFNVLCCLTNDNQKLLYQPHGNSLNQWHCVGLDEHDQLAWLGIRRHWVHKCNHFHRYLSRLRCAHLPLVHSCFRQLKKVKDGLRLQEHGINHPRWSNYLLLRFPRPNLLQIGRLEQIRNSPPNHRDVLTYSLSDILARHNLHYRSQQASRRSIIYLYVILQRLEDTRAEHEFTEQMDERIGK